MSQDLSALPPLRDIIRENDLRAEKKLGQNFLLDLNLTDKIVRAAGNLSDTHVIEIGPGPGGLTRSLVKSRAQKITAIEYDMRAIQALQSLTEVAEDRLEVFHGDALETDLKNLAKKPRAIVANLPYNIATPLLIKWLEDVYNDSNAYQSMTLMFQKEVAQRIVAGIGDKAYGRLAVIAQWLCDVQLSFDVPASAFTPPPKVTSSIVYFQPKKERISNPSFKAVEKITSEAFGQRRKMIRSSLKKYQSLFDGLGLDETLRAENLTVENFICLAQKAEENNLL
jgi:16S rRNA (adenine1518-N6/adenine1519-N6)-dimethyltransferase